MAMTPQEQQVFNDALAELVTVKNEVAQLKRDKRYLEAQLRAVVRAFNERGEIIDILKEKLEIVRAQRDELRDRWERRLVKVGNIWS